MSKMKIQCRGSGSHVGGLAKRYTCASCATIQDVNSNGRIRKHMRIVTKGQLRKMG